jgi:iron complex transport system ATP-binding protein
MSGLHHAGVRYGTRWIFRGIDLAPAVGRSLAILGPNGRGKTTLVRALLGFQPLSEGTRTVPDVIGYVPQAIGRDLTYPVRQMVAMGRVARRGLFAMPTGADYEHADHALERVGIAAFAEHAFDRLSGGERQLVLLARALATEAAILVLDEPASALDLRNQDRFLTVVDSLRSDGQHAIVFTTHLPQHAATVADDALLMFGVEERILGPVAETLNEDNLARLYGLPVRIVELSEDRPRPIRGIVPLFSTAGSL